MSVLACERYGCRNIMCNRHSNAYGYICNECFFELIELGSGVDVAGFMASPAPDPIIDAYAEFPLCDGSEK